MTVEDYKLKLVEQDGHGGWDIIDVLTKPSFQQPITQQLNAIGSTAIVISPNDEAHAFFYQQLATDWLKREVQIFRGDEVNPIWWGVPMRPQRNIGSDPIALQISEVPWLLTRRYFGKPERDNHLSNPQFEGGLAGWTPVGVATSSSDAFHVLGTKSAKLVQAAQGVDTYIRQRFTISTNTQATTVFVVAWVYIDNWIGPAYQKRGILALDITPTGKVRYTSVATIDENTSRGNWVRLETTIDVPTFTTDTIEVRLYAPGGTVYWDASQAVQPESTSANYPGGSDLRVLAGRILQIAQDPSFLKDDLGIADVGDMTGRKLFTAWQHADHQNIWQDGIGDLINLENGIDVGWDYFPADRHAHIYSRVDSATGQGVFHTNPDNVGTYVDMRLYNANTAPEGWVADYGWTKDGEQAGSGIVILGDGNDASREEGGYRDPSAFGGRAFEFIIPAPTGSTIDSLDDRAAVQGPIKRRPYLLNVALMPGKGVGAGITIGVGDRLLVPEYDPHIEAGVWRVMETSLNPETDSLSLGLNPERLEAPDPGFPWPSPGIFPAEDLYPEEP